MSGDLRTESLAHVYVGEKKITWHLFLQPERLENNGPQIFIAGWGIK